MQPLVVVVPDICADRFVHLVAVTKKHRPETTVNLTVKDPDDLKTVLTALGAAHPKR